MQHNLFQPTPRFVSEANAAAVGAGDALALFQPTPRFVSEANVSIVHAPPVMEVSTHAPLRQRGERRSPSLSSRVNWFQPTPRFVSEANEVK